MKVRRPILSAQVPTSVHILGVSKKRAELLLRLKYRDVFIAEIETAGLRRENLPIEFADVIVNLPVLTDREGSLFFSMVDAGRCFGINHATIQRSEWLAVHQIPVERITRLVRYWISSS